MRICIVSQQPSQNCHHDWSSNLKDHFLPPISSTITGSVHYPSGANDCCEWRVDTACEHDEATAWCNISISRTHVFKMDQQAYAQGRCDGWNEYLYQRNASGNKNLKQDHLVLRIYDKVSQHKNTRIYPHTCTYTQCQTPTFHTGWMFPKFCHFFFWYKSKSISEFKCHHSVIFNGPVPFFLLSISLSHRVIHVAFCRDCSFLLHHWHKAFVLAPFCCFQRCFSKIFATCVIVCFVVSTLWQIGGSVCVFDFNVCLWYCVCRDLWHCQGFEFEMFCSKDVYEF